MTTKFIKSIEKSVEDKRRTKEAIELLKDLIKHIEKGYFHSYFVDRGKDYKISYDKFARLVKDFLECRIIELEDEGTY